MISTDFWVNHNIEYHQIYADMPQKLLTDQQEKLFSPKRRFE
jgi:hypothetical protein